MELPHSARHRVRREPPIHWNAANLLLLVPLLTLFTPFYNRIEPRLGGLPFFYWFPLAMLLLTMAFSALFFALTRTGGDDIDRTWR